MKPRNHVVLALLKSKRKSGAHGKTKKAIRRDVVDCDAILARTELYPAEVLEAAPRLKVIARHGVGVDNIDVAAAERLGIWVTVAGTANFNTVAEVGLGFIIALGRQTGFFERNAKSGNWAVRNKISGIDLEGKTLGLIGFGKIGRCLADKARLDVLIPEGALVFSPRVGFRNPKQVERRTVDVDPTALNAGSHHGSTFYQHQRFIAAVRGEGAVEVTANDGLMAVAIGTAAEISAREKRVVEMAELGL